MTNEAEISLLEEPSVQAPVPEKSVLEKPVKPESPALKELIAHLEKLGPGEERIQYCLESMQAALGYKVPRFKDYWEIKRICLPLFKEVLTPQVRSLLWEKYIEISTEARHLKEILDSQASFAMEQIDLAIQAVEADLKNYPELAKNENGWSLPEDCQFIYPKKEIYETLQRELNTLNNFAARVSSLRKEVIRTEMRIRYKNKFFDRLSLAGDSVFPRRKELVKQISATFAADITEFATYAASEEGQKQTPIFELREEIKALQLVAKELTLDTHTFKETRLQLGTCWDLLKEKDKERKKEIAEKQSIFQNNHDSHDREKEVEVAEQQKRDKIQEFKKRLKETQGRKLELSVEQLLLLKDEFHKQLALLVMTQAERELLEQALKEFRDHINDKKEKAIASLSPEERNSLQNLKLRLADWDTQKQEIRKQLEVYRTALSGSGFDFEKAIYYRGLFDAEKARLEKANVAIEEIEEKIEELENQ